MYKQTLGELIKAITELTWKHSYYNTCPCYRVHMSETFPILCQPEWGAKVAVLFSACLIRLARLVRMRMHWPTTLRSVETPTFYVRSTLYTATESETAL